MGPGYYAFVLIVLFVFFLPIWMAGTKMGKGCFTDFVKGIAALLLIMILILLCCASCS